MGPWDECAPDRVVGRAPRGVPYRGSVPSVRRPRFLPFIVTGAFLGFVVGLYLAGRPDEAATRTLGTYDPSAAIGYLGIGCAALGALLAAVVALLLERRREGD